MITISTPFIRGSTMAKSWGEPRFGFQHRGARSGCGILSPPPVVGAQGSHPQKIFKNSDAKSYILVTTTLISGLPWKCISQQTTSMSRAKSVPKFQFFCIGCALPLLEPKNQLDGKYETILPWNFLLFENYGLAKKLGDHYIVGQPNIKVGDQSSRCLRLLRLCLSEYNPVNRQADEMKHRNASACGAEVICRKWTQILQLSYAIKASNDAVVDYQRISDEWADLADCGVSLSSTLWIKSASYVSNRYTPESTSLTG